MAVTVDVVAQLDEESTEKAVAEIRARAKQAVLDGIGDAIREVAAESGTLLAASLSGLLAGNVGDATA